MVKKLYLILLLAALGSCLHLQEIIAADAPPGTGTITVQANPASGGRATGGGIYTSAASVHPYLQVKTKDGKLAFLRPSGGRNDGSDDGSANAGKDVTAHKYSPTQNRGSLDVLELLNSNCNDFIAESFIRFDVSGMPAASQVDEARVVFFHWIHQGGGLTYQVNPTIVEVYTVLTSWNENTLTWNNRPLVNLNPESSFNIQTPLRKGVVFDGPVSLDITNLYKNWKNSLIINNGIRYSRKSAFCENMNNHLVYSSDYQGRKLHDDHTAVGDTVTLTATAAAGYEFVNWTEGATEVSRQASFSFTAVADRSLAANFRLLPVQDTPPSVTILAPTEGAEVSGTVTLLAAASDDKGVAKVEFQVDGTKIGEDTISPYSIIWNAKQATAGTHVIKVKAYDTIGCLTVLGPKN